MPVELYHTLPAVITRQPTAFHAELALALTGMMGLPKDGDTFLSFSTSTIDPAEAPLPYFREIPIPANCPPRLRTLIDANGDGFVSHINEAWQTYLLATQPAAWDPDSAAALQALAAQLTHVAPDKSGIRVGTRVIRVHNAISAVSTDAAGTALSRSA